MRAGVKDREKRDGVWVREVGHESWSWREERWAYGCERWAMRAGVKDREKRDGRTVARGGP